jgi:hypothetical protein
MMSYYEITTRDTRQTLTTYTLEPLALKLTNLYYLQSPRNRVTTARSFII